LSNFSRKPGILEKMEKQQLLANEVFYLKNAVVRSWRLLLPPSVFDSRVPAKKFAERPSEAQAPGPRAAPSDQFPA